jgi:hypothetical protein
MAKEYCDSCGEEFEVDPDTVNVQYAGLDFYGHEMYYCKKCHDGWVD